MRPMDSSWLHNSHGGAHRLPPLPCRLWTDHLLDLHHLKQVQVINILIYVYCTWKYPGCVTQEIWTWAPSATWPAPLWWNGCQPSTQPTATSTPPTPEGCLDPRDQDTHQPWLRKNYFLLFQRWMISFHNCENQNFLSKGKPQVQRLWQGHCCVQSLLWRLNCVW